MNARVHYALGASVAVAALSLLALELRGSTLGAKGGEPAAARPAPRAERHPGDQRELSRLKAEIASLQTRVASIQTGLAEKASLDAERAEASSEDPGDPAVALTPQESRARSDAEWQAHMADVATAFADEPVAKDWSIEKQELVQAQLQNSPILSAAAGGVECRSRSCRIEFTGDHAEVNRELAMFVHQLGSTLPKAQAERIDEADGRVTMVLYVSERGDDPNAPRGPSGSE